MKQKNSVQSRIFLRTHNFANLPRKSITMFTTNPVLLKDLLDKIESGKIQLPDFQRGWVWDDDRIRSLLASISLRFPIGAIMTLSSGIDIKFMTRTIEGVNNINDFPDEFLLDGQQRLTSLYQSLRHHGPVDTHDNRGQRIKRRYYIDMKAAMDHLVDREDAIVSVPENGKLAKDFGKTIILDLSTPTLEYEHHMIPTNQLLEPMSWMFKYCKHWSIAERQNSEGNPMEFFEKFQQVVLNNFTDYQLPIINLDKKTPKEAVCTVFEKVNTGGITLNVFELVTASIAADAEDFSLRDDWNCRKERLYSHAGVLQGVQGDQFLQVIALLKTQEDRRLAISGDKHLAQIPGIGCKKRDILNLKYADYLRWADKAEEGFIEAATFLHTQFVFDLRNVPYTSQLVPLAALYADLNSELFPAIANNRLEHWFWSGIFGEVYGGAIETQIALDLVQVTAYVRDGTPPTLVTQANFIPERLLTLRTRNSAAYKGLYALQMKNGASDWISDNSISMASHRERNIDIHHIFPKFWCRKEAKPVIPARLYNSVINKTPIDAYTNRVIGGSTPSRYLPKLRTKMPSDELLDQILKSHWLDIRTLEQDDFARSFIERGETMLNMIGKAMGRELGIGRDVFENALQTAGYEETVTFDEEEEYDEIGEDIYEEHSDDIYSS